MGDEERLAGGHDSGASLVHGSVRRDAGPWTPAVQHLLEHLTTVGFDAAPRALGLDAEGRECLTYLEGDTVGDALPWPAWTHADETLDQVGAWLRDYHEAVLEYVPPHDAVWREGGTWEPGLIIAHNDAAPYNAVWSHDDLVGFVDWDNAGPTTNEADLAWMALSWAPLHAPAVVAREGFTDLGRRRERLQRLLDAYGYKGRVGDVLDLLAARLAEHLETMRSVAERGDATYQRMLAEGQDRSLEIALAGLADI